MRSIRYTSLFSSPIMTCTLADIAALMKNQLAKIGVEAKIHLMDLTAAIDRVWSSTTLR